MRTAKLKRQQIKFFGEKNCSYCGVDLKSLPTPPHFDHVVPRIRGGSNHASNVLIVCQWCNLTKGKRSLNEARPALIQKKIGWPQFTLAQRSWLRSNGFDMTPYDNSKLWFEEQLGCTFGEPDKKTG